MDQQLQEQQKQKEIKMSKYQIGKKGEISCGYNPITGQYETSNKGEAVQIANRQREMRQIARAQNLDNSGDSPYNLINGAESSPKIALLKARRNQLATSGTSSPFVPMTQAYMPQQTSSFAKPSV